MKSAFANGSTVQPARLVLPRELCPGGGEGRASRHGDLGCFFGAADPRMDGFCFGKSAQVDLGVAPKNRTPPYFI